MKLSVVIPAYNEEESLPETLRSLYETLVKHQIDHEICVTNDNSKDNTEAVLQNLQKEIPTYREYITNRSKTCFLYNQKYEQKLTKPVTA